MNYSIRLSCRCCRRGGGQNISYLLTVRQKDANILLPATSLNADQFSNQAYSEYKHSLRFRFRRSLCCHSNETRVPIANPPNSAQLDGTPTILPTYIRVSAVVWECGEGQTHRRPWPLYISSRSRLTRNVNIFTLRLSSKFITNLWLKIYHG